MYVINHIHWQQTKPKILTSGYNIKYRHLSLAIQHDIKMTMCFGHIAVSGQEHGKKNPVSTRLQCDVRL